MSRHEQHYAIWECDGCGQEVQTGITDPLPRGWITLTAGLLEANTCGSDNCVRVVLEGWKQRVAELAATYPAR